MSCQLKIVTRGLASICLKRKGYFGKQRTFLIEQNPDLWSPLPAGHTVPGHRAPAASLWQPALQSSATPGLMKRLLSLVSHHSVNARKKEKEVFHRNGVRTVGLLEECQLYVRQNMDGYRWIWLFSLVWMTLGSYSSPEMLFVSPQDVQPVLDACSAFASALPCSVSLFPPAALCSAFVSSASDTSKVPFILCFSISVSTKYCTIKLARS